MKVCFFKYYCRTELNLYYTPGSPPCRSVLLTAKALGLVLNLKTVDLFKNEHMKPEFLKVSFRKKIVLFKLLCCTALIIIVVILQLNPQHSIPTLEIGEFVMWER